jgi:copper resistance protein D
MRLVYLAAVWCHVLAAMVWIGGMAFLTLVIVPALRDVDLGSRRVELLHHTGVRFRTVAWVALGILVGTGSAILLLRGVGWAALASGAFWTTGFGRVLAVKLLLVAAILASSVAHDFVLGPRATRQLRADPSSPEALRLRRTATLLGRGNLLLALAVVALAVMLLRGLP